MGRWSECYERACIAEDILRDHYDRLTWERDTAALFKGSSLRWMGRWAEMQALLPGLIEDARARGDLYAESVLQMQCGTSCELARDTPDRARDGLKLLDRWSNTGFHLEHLMETYNQVEISLYLGNAKEAFETVVSRWPALNKSFLLRVQTLNIRMRSLLARAALAKACQEESIATRTPLLKLVEREVRAIKREDARWGIALAEMLQAGVASLTKSRDEAIAAFVRAEQLLVLSDMQLHCAIARRSRGMLVGGNTGSDMVREADTTLFAEGIRHPERIAAIFAPGKYLLRCEYKLI